MRSSPRRASRALATVIALYAGALYAGALYAGALFTSACTNAVVLTVDLVTDYVPEEEFTVVRTELSTAPFEGPGLEDGATILAANRDQRFFDGARVAELRGLTPGARWVRVSLLRVDGTLLAERVTEVRVDTNVSITTVVSRSCGETTCPPSGTPALIACNGGVCVDPRCTVESPEFCGAGECVRDADCVDGPAGECVRAVCEGSACLYAADDRLCASGERCTAAFACAPTTPRDAGLPDAARPDVGASDGGPTCPATETACRDGVDDDCDGAIDCADPDCGGSACDDGNACTYGDACAAGACAGTAISCVGDGCMDRACNGTAVCTSSPHGAGTSCGDDGNSCTTDTCDGAGSCTHPGLPGFSACASDGNDCTWDLCDGAATCVHPNHDGLRIFFTAICCGGRTVDVWTDHDNCGACGISCGSGSCVNGECTCFSNLECMGQGYGPLATCFGNRCQCRCNGDETWRGQCGDQCAGGATCDQTDGLNHCIYP